MATRKGKGPPSGAGMRGQATANDALRRTYGPDFHPAKEFAGLGSSYCHNSTISSGQRVGKIVGNRGFTLPRVPSCKELSSLEVLDQLVEHLVPALRRPVEIRPRRHPGVMQCDLRLVLR